MTKRGPNGETLIMQPNGEYQEVDKNGKPVPKKRGPPGTSIKGGYYDESGVFVAVSESPSPRSPNKKKGRLHKGTSHMNTSNNQEDGPGYKTGNKSCYKVDQYGN